jgi:hypothetical protein
LSQYRGSVHIPSMGMRHVMEVSFVLTVLKEEKRKDAELKM